MFIVLHGRIPSKKNSKRIVMFGHRPGILSSKDYMAWHTIASYELVAQCRGQNTGEAPFVVKVDFYGPSAQKFDLTNKAESIMDLLVDNLVIKDDSWGFIKEICLEFKGIDRKNPRAEITIRSSASTA